MYKGKTSEATLPSGGAIGDESCRDRPIYVRVYRYGKNDEINCWYVIEEKPLKADSSPSSSGSADSSSSSEEDWNNDVLLECTSESDIVRRLSVPESVVWHTSLAVLNSHVYLIGGDIGTRYNKQENIGYRQLDLARPHWQLGGGRLLYAQYGAAAVGHDGFIYSVGCHQFRLSPKTGIIEKLPPPPGENNEDMYESHLLALTKKKLFIYINTGWGNRMFSYDLEKGKWDGARYPDFAGNWSSGVVLYDDRYLFAFGTQDPMSPEPFVRLKEARQVVPGIYVFDIVQRKWLKKPVKGLRTDGTVLPYDYKIGPDVEGGGTGLYPYLFQIGRQNDHKLALLWDYPDHHPKSGLPQCTICWSKFIISSSTTSDPEPQFYVDSLSTGLCALDETDHLLNCAAGM